MTKPTPEELRTLSVLVHLPYDADKLFPLKELELKQGAATGIVNADENFYSFKNLDGSTAYYKKIAQGEENKKGADKDHDAAAFVEIDDKGKVLLKDGKANVVTVFPGLNNPLSDINEAVIDMNKTSSFSQKYYDQFQYNYESGLNKNGLNENNIKVSSIGHSMGDKYAAEFAANNPQANVIIVGGWDSRDALVGAAIRKTLSHGYQNESEFREALDKNLTVLQEVIVDVRSKKDRKEHLVDNTDYIKDASHRAREFINIDADRIIETNRKVSSDNTDLVDYAIKNLEKFVLQDLKNDLKIDGDFNHNDKELFKMAKDMLKESGIQLENVEFIHRVNILINQKDTAPDTKGEKKR